MADKDKQQALVEKAFCEVEKAQGGSKVDFVGLSWISKCLEEEKVVDGSPFEIKPKKKAPKAKNSPDHGASSKARTSKSMNANSFRMS